MICIMAVSNLEQQLSKKILQPVYVFYGEEKYLIENNINKIKKIFGTLQEGINYCTFDATNIDNIISEIETPCFGYERKLIIVKNANLLSKKTSKKNTAKSSKDDELDNNENMTKTSKIEKNEKDSISSKLAQYMEENFKTIQESVILIIVEDKIDKCTLLNTLKKFENSIAASEQDIKGENILSNSNFTCGNKVMICEFQKLKLNELVNWLKKVCDLYKVQVEKSTLEYLVETSGTSMQNLLNEIRKIIEYVGEGGKITKKEIELLAIQEVDNIIFNLTDNLGTKNIKNALDILHDLIYMKEPLQSIMINLYRHFKKLYYVKISEKDGGTQNIAEVLDLKPNQMFLVSKYKRQATFFKEEELRKFLKGMLELDESYKNGNIDLLIGLETLIMSV